MRRWLPTLRKLRRTSKCLNCSFLCMIMKALDRSLREVPLKKNHEELDQKRQARKRGANALPLPKVQNQQTSTNLKKMKTSLTPI